VALAREPEAKSDFTNRRPPAAEEPLRVLDGAAYHILVRRLAGGALEHLGERARREANGGGHVADPDALVQRGVYEVTQASDLVLGK
jgi:hypothetical protein